MRVIKKHVEYDSRSEKEWFIVPIGDIHLGNSNIDLDLLERVIEFVKSNERCLWIGMGDYCDAITTKDKRYDINSVDKEFATPDVQYRKIENMFKPIADKCIGLLDGNHDYQHWLDHGHNYVDSMAFNLGVHYLTMDAYIRLNFKRKKVQSADIDIYAHHGWSNARGLGGRVNRIDDLSMIFPNLDLYLMGHVHLLGSSPSKFQLRVDRNLNIVQQKEQFVFTGSFLRGYVDGNVSYVERKTYAPTALGSPKIKILLFPGRYHRDVRISVEDIC